MSSVFIWTSIFYIYFSLVSSLKIFVLFCRNYTSCLEKVRICLLLKGEMELYKTYEHEERHDVDIET